MSLTQLIQTPNLAALGPLPRADRVPLAELQMKIAAAFETARISAPTQKLIHSLVLLRHDHLDESHTMSQDIESIDGSFLHGIMHRREPDYSNAKYWFRRAGTHPSFPQIASRCAELFNAPNTAKLKAQLLPAGRWDSFAMVDAVEASAPEAASANARLLQRIQQIEFEVLLDRFSAMH